MSPYEQSFVSLHNYIRDIYVEQSFSGINNNYYFNPIPLLQILRFVGIYIPLDTISGSKSSP